MLKIKNEIKKPTALALGNFDGLHGGHTSVLEAALSKAKEKDLVPAVLLFDEHPKKILFGKRPPMLMTEEMKNECFEQMGFSIVTVSFEQAKDLSPKEFLTLIKKELNVRVICCGYDYRFGKGAAGSVETLTELCTEFGIELFAVEEKKFDGGAISSTRIRAEIEKGNIEKANAMLGREFSYKFEVVKGDQRGRTLGFPTANQFFPDDFVKPRSGVYASKVFLNNRWYPAVTNIGIRPTIGSGGFRSETCILGFSDDLYGKELTVYLLSFMRDECKFEGLQQLKTAIAKDAETATEIFKRNGNGKEAKR